LPCKNNCHSTFFISNLFFAPTELIAFKCLSDSYSQPQSFLPSEHFGQDSSLQSQDFFRLSMPPILPFNALRLLFGKP
jgi:hypothetical protein